MDQQQSPKRQQMKSCDTCRKRKVRCDSISRSTCSNCQKANIECRYGNPYTTVYVNADIREDSLRIGKRLCGHDESTVPLQQLLRLLAQRTPKAPMGSLLDPGVQPDCRRAWSYPRNWLEIVFRSSFSLALGPQSGRYSRP
jgi:hypothetical protein